MKYLRFFVLVALLFSVAVSASAATSLVGVQKRIYQAAQMWDKDPAQAQSRLKGAFADAITFTRPEFIDPLREKGFYLAVSCYSPELVSETMLAADTYLKIFPKGKYVGKVNLFKAMAAFAAGDEAAAVAALEKAQNHLGKSMKYSEQTLFMNGYVSAGYHRSAEKFIEGQRLVKPSAKLTRDLRKFHRGNRKVENALKKLEEGKISGLAAAELLEKELQGSYFAKKAPEAALTAAAIKDHQRLAYNPVALEWCGLKRAVKHSSSPQLREKKYKDFLDSYPQAAPAETYTALQNLRNIYLYEMRDKILARKVLETMKRVPGFEERAEVEEIFCDFTSADVITEPGLNFLKKLFESQTLVPYDNGALPVLDRSHLEFLLMISEMALGRGSRLKGEDFTGWGGLPLSMLYAAATDNKDRAWEIFSQRKPALSPQVDRMLEDLIFPLYLPVPVGERYFLAGLAAVEKLPDLGTDLLIKAISGEPRMFRVEHGLAVLADVYNRHLAYGEAQKVWNLLAKINPDSVWLK